MGRSQKLKQERKIARLKREKEKKERKKRIIIFSLFFFLVILLSSGGFWTYQEYFSADDNSTATKENTNEEIKRNFEEYPEMVINKEKEYIALVNTSMGKISLKLYSEDAPKTVNNFVFLAGNNFYNNLTFHRVIKDFMIQGGDPEGNGSGGPGYEFENEESGHKFKKGSLGMANSGKDTNGSQFFIVTGDKIDFLDGKYTNFGEVTSGIEIAEKIEKVETNEDDKPKEEVVINGITIEEK